MMCGNMCEGADDREFKEATQKVLSRRSVLFHPQEFITAEAMGTELPRRCPVCKTVRSASSGWIACCLKRTLNTR
jgi:hypothetical protein